MKPSYVNSRGEKSTELYFRPCYIWQKDIFIKHVVMQLKASMQLNVFVYNINAFIYFLVILIWNRVN